MVCYAEKQEKPFWFSSLGQIVQFGAIIFCRTFKNYFGQFVWIEKKVTNSRVSLHEAPTKNVNVITVLQIVFINGFFYFSQLNVPKLLVAYRRREIKILQTFLF